LGSLLVEEFLEDIDGLSIVLEVGTYSKELF
jgi:hypothetical protein